MLCCVVLCASCIVVYTCTTMCVCTPGCCTDVFLHVCSLLSAIQSSPKREGAQEGKYYSMPEHAIRGIVKYNIYSTCISCNYDFPYCTGVIILHIHQVHSNHACNWYAATSSFQRVLVMSSFHSSGGLLLYMHPLIIMTALEVHYHQCYHTHRPYGNTIPHVFISCFQQVCAGSEWIIVMFAELVGKPSRMHAKST